MDLDLGLVLLCPNNRSLPAGGETLGTRSLPLSAPGLDPAEELSSGLGDVGEIGVKVMVGMRALQQQQIRCLHRCHRSDHDSWPPLPPLGLRFTSSDLARRWEGSCNDW